MACQQMIIRGILPRNDANRMAGHVAPYSHQATALLAEALGQFARPQALEKSAAELRRLLQIIMESPERVDTGPTVYSAERRLGDERVAALLERYEAGVTANALGMEFGISAASVMRTVRRHGLVVHEQVGISDHVLAEAIRFYRDGYGVQKVADRLQISKSSLLRAFKSAGEQLRPPRR